MPMGPFPEQSVNFLSFLTFWWVTPLVVLGKKRPLEVCCYFLQLFLPLLFVVGGRVTSWAFG